jgi:hypothetical protein
MKYKNGEEVKVGDVIRWLCDDSDDHTTWTFTGLVKNDFVLYLGGGIDFGFGIGNAMSFSEVEEKAANNDCDDVGITRVCSCVELARAIANLPAPPQVCT